MPSADATMAAERPVLVASSSIVTSPSVVPVTSESELVESQQSARQEGSILWVEKWRPRHIRDILGNGDTIKKFTTWLRDWHDVCILGNLKVPAKPRGGRFAEPEKPNSRACMLSGPPGVGKTTAARVVASDCGFDIVEYNSSDDRGKGIVEVIQDMTSGGQTLKGFLGLHKEKEKKKKVVLIMDEMDGLSAGDRGGAQALVKLIEKTLCPVVCICNDRTHPKVKTLASKCYDLRFSKPPKNSVAKRICEIAAQQGLNVEYNAAELLCERVGNDLRQILNTLQLFTQSSTTKSTGVTFDMMRKEIGYGLKDGQVMVNPFDVTRKLLTKSESSRMSFNDKLDGYFVDYDIMPLYMEENYISAFMSQLPANSQGGGRVTTPAAYDLVANVADCFTFADILNKKVRKDGNWSLLGDVELFSTVVPSCQSSGFLARADFPRWLGKNSTTTKNRRLLNELNLYLSPVTTATPTAMRVSGYLELLYAKMMEPLLDNQGVSQKEAAAKTMELMDMYGLTKEHVTENMGSHRLKCQDMLFDLVDSSMKRTLTTLYNGSTHVVRMAPPQFSVKKKGSNQRANGHMDNLLVTEEGDAEGTAPNKESASKFQGASLTGDDGKGGDSDEQDDNETDSAFLDRLILKNKKQPSKGKSRTISKTKSPTSANQLSPKKPRAKKAAAKKSG